MLQTSFQSFPTLKTVQKGIILEPLAEKHAKFYISLLNEPSVQKTLFRTPHTVKPESFHKSLEKMQLSPPQEIVYILSQKKLLGSTPFGYIKLKLIDWYQRSAYISVAITDKTEFRGKGYSAICYNAIFEYLFSKGFLKIYGRTFEENVATIKLNLKTGFRFIGRNKYFMVSTKDTTQDALFFEKLSPAIASDLTHQLKDPLQKVYDIHMKYNENDQPITQLEKPINFKEEFAQWKKTKGNYVPQFRYNTELIQEKITKTKETIAELNKFCEETENMPLDWKEFIKRGIGYLELKQKDLVAIGTPDFNKTNKDLYLAQLEERFIAQAEKIAENGSKPKKQKETVLSQNDVSFKTQAFITQFFKGAVTVELKDKSAAGSVNFQRRVLSLSTKYSYTASSLQRTLFHESIHLINHLNALQFQSPLLSIQTTPGANWFQEGLATYFTHTFFEETEYPYKSTLNWKLKQLFDSSSPRELYDAIYSNEMSLISEKDKDLLLERFWKGVSGDSLQYTHKRLQYLPGFLFVKELFSTETEQDYLKGILSPVDYTLLFSQFMGRDFRYSLSTLFAIKASLVSLFTVAE